MIREQKEARMAEDGEDWNGLEMTILNSLANFFKIHKWWWSSFKGNCCFLRACLMIDRSEKHDHWLSWREFAQDSMLLNGSMRNGKRNFCVFVKMYRDVERVWKIDNAVHGCTFPQLHIVGCPQMFESVLYNSERKPIKFQSIVLNVYSCMSSSAIPLICVFLQLKIRMMKLDLGH